MVSTQNSAFQTVYAQACVSRLSVDPYFKQAWRIALDQAKQLPQSERAASMNAFLASQGYDTTIELVQQAFDQAIDPADLPNGSAMMFAIQLLTDVDLFCGWVNACSQTVRADSSLDLAPIENFLAQNGVEASTAQVVNAVGAVINGRSGQTANTEPPKLMAVQAKAAAATTDPNSLAGITPWVGAYGNTTISKEGTSEVTGPALIVTANYVSIGRHRLIQPQFDATTATLTWKNEGSGVTNDTAGSITFSNRSQTTPGDNYTGNEFSGTLTLPDSSTYPVKGTVDYFGRITAIPSSDPPIIPNADYDLLTKFVGPLITGLVATVGMIVLVAKMVREFPKLKLEMDKLRLEAEKLSKELGKTKNKAEDIGKDWVKVKSQASSDDPIVKKMVNSFEDGVQIFEDYGSINQTISLSKQIEKTTDPSVKKELEEDFDETTSLLINNTKKSINDDNSDSSSEVDDLLKEKN